MQDGDDRLVADGWEPSVYQRRIFEDVKRGTGHVLVRARAGCAKTTTILRALLYVPKDCEVAFFAFANSIVDVLVRRAPEGVFVSTLHKQGMRTIGRYHEAEIEPDKTRILARKMFGSERDRHPVRGYYDELDQLVRAAKDTMRPLEAEALDALLDRFGIDAPPDVVDPRVPELKFRPGVQGVLVGGGGGEVSTEGVEAENVGETEAKAPLTARRVFLEAAIALLKESERRTDIVDFADMCWLPVRLRLAPRQFDRIFVDETQDLSPSQILFLLACCAPGGRICAIGDDAQSIHQYRGADASMMDKLKAHLKAREFALPMSYRCCRAVVKLAQTVVPDMEAAPNAPEGRVLERRVEDLIADAKPGDFVVSRSNAALVGLCVRLVHGNRRRVAVKGRDVFESLRSFLLRFEEDDAMLLRIALARWLANESMRLTELGRSPDVVRDRYATALALLRGSDSLKAALRLVDRAFVPDRRVEEDGVDAIVLGTTHKLKGLEADRVWMLTGTFHPDRGGEEQNCWYVALSRARTTLFLVRDRREEEERGW